VKKHLRTSIIYVGLGFLPMGVNFLLAPLYSHLLSPEQNALVGQATLVQGFMAVFLNFSIDGGFSRMYFDYYKSRVQLYEYLSSVLIFTILLSFLILIILYFFGNYIFMTFQKNGIFTFTKYGIWVFITTLCVLLQSVFLAYFRNEEKPLQYSLVSLSYFFFALGFTLVGLLIFRAEALGSIIGKAGGYLLATLIYLVLFFLKTGLKFNFFQIKKSLHFSIPIMPYLFSMALYTNIDRIIIERFFTLHDLGIYNFALIIASAVAVFISASQNTLIPVIYKELAEERINETKINRIFTFFHYGVTIIISIGLFITIFFTNIFIAKEYRSFLNYIGILFLAYIFRAYYLIYINNFFFYKKTKWIFLITLTSFLIGVLFNYLLIPWFGIVGVCLTVLLINMTQAFGAYYQLAKYKMLCSYFKLRRNHVYTSCLVFSYFAGLLISDVFNISAVWVNCIPFLITLGFALYLLVYSKGALSRTRKLIYSIWRS